jgi:predicted MFS family arabinose efflux permease
MTPVPEHNKHANLYRDSDFVKLWSGQSISIVGSQVTALALPLTAVITLQATAMQMGVLTAIQYAPFLLFGLFIGVWVDRLRRRPILIAANLGRGLLLGLIPVAALLGVLRIGQLYALGFLTGVLTVCFDVAYVSYLPGLVGRGQLVDGNSKLQISSSTAAFVGPSLGGVLVQWLTAPVAIAVDAVSFFVSAVFLYLIRRPEPEPQPVSQRGIWSEMREGLRPLISDPIMLAIMVGTATSNFFINMQISVRLLYITRDLRLSPATLGFMFATASLGGLVAAVFAKRIYRGAGIGPTLIVTQLLVGISALALPLAGGGYWAIIITIMASMILWGFAMMAYDITEISFRQFITPDGLLGRVSASRRFVTWGVALPGALLGGVLGEAVGLRTTLLIGGGGVVCAALWPIFSPARKLRHVDDAGAAAEAPAATPSAQVRLEGAAHGVEAPAARNG